MLEIPDLKGVVRLETVEDRSLLPGDKVQVYKNLNRSCFSIRSKKTGLVVAYADTVTLSDVIYKVSEAGLQRVLKTGIRSVHAYIEGIFMVADLKAPPAGANQLAYYQPFTTDHFHVEGSATKVHHSKIAHCQNRRVFFEEIKSLCN